MSLSRNHFLVLGLAVPLLTGCAGPGADTGVSEAQFSDMPVPDGMKLVTGDARSHSFEAGAFRFGRFEYRGGLPIQAAANHMRDRMPLDGWMLIADSADSESTDSDSAPGPQPVELLFHRGQYRYKCLIHSDEALTRMVVDYTTGDAVSPK